VTLSPAEQESLRTLHREAVWAKENNQLVRPSPRVWRVLLKCAIEQTKQRGKAA